MYPHLTLYAPILLIKKVYFKINILQELYMSQGFAARRPKGHAISLHNNFNICILFSLLMCIYIYYMNYSLFSGLFFICNYFCFCIFHIDIVHECIVLRCIVKNKRTYLLHLFVFPAPPPPTCLNPHFI